MKPLIDNLTPMLNAYLSSIGRERKAVLGAGVC
jgi:hypothetical protein